MSFFQRKPKPLIDRFDAIARKDAVLCLDCDTITAARNGHCPCCGNIALLSLANLLDGRENAALCEMRSIDKPRGAKIFELVPRRG
jgi:hypothetical protein